MYSYRELCIAHLVYSSCSVILDPTTPPSPIRRVARYSSGTMYIPDALSVTSLAEAVDVRSEYLVQR